MSDHNAPNDPKRFTLTAFIAFAAVFVFLMMMMMWHGSYTRTQEGKMQYNTKQIEPTKGGY